MASFRSSGAKWAYRIVMVSETCPHGTTRVSHGAALTEGWRWHQLEHTQRICSV
jgi:hypothetical protein